MKKVLKKLLRIIRSICQKRYESRQKRRLRQNDFSIISSNCIGGIICHILGIRFNSPFVNLWIKGDDYVKLLYNLKEYMSLPLEFTKEEGIEYPIGQLGDINIYFMHYKSEKDALEKWNIRKGRINYDKLYLVHCDNTGGNYQDLVKYDALPYKKVLFTNKNLADIESMFKISGYDNVEIIDDYSKKEGKFVKKYLFEQFDYVKWLND